MTSNILILLLLLLVPLSSTSALPVQCAEIPRSMVGDGQGNTTIYTPVIVPNHERLEHILGPKQGQPTTFYIPYRINYYSCDPTAIIDVMINDQIASSISVSTCAQLSICEDTLKVTLLHFGLLAIGVVKRDTKTYLDYVEIEVKKRYKLAPTITVNIGNNDQFKITLGRGSYIPYSDLYITMSNLKWNLKIGQFTSIAEGFQVFSVAKGGANAYEYK